jgi:hypothetical protein
MMSGDRFPNLMGLLGFADDLLGCVFGLLKLAFWLLVVVFVVGLIAGNL